MYHYDCVHFFLYNLLIDAGSVAGIIVCFVLLLLVVVIFIIVVIWLYRLVTELRCHAIPLSKR